MNKLAVQAPQARQIRALSLYRPHVSPPFAIRHRFPAILGDMIPVPAFIEQTPATESQKIEALIQAISRLRGAVFIRNGSEHTPQQAADHLRLKWRNAGKRVKTAPDFIRTCGTGSSLSGNLYQIRLQDGRTVAASDWLWTELKRLEAGH